MADVQPEDGFTRIAHPVLEALARSPIPARHLRVVLALARLTWGWGRKVDRIGSKQLAAAVDIEASEVRKILGDLIGWRVVREEGPTFRGCRTMGLEKNFERWAIGTTRAAVRRRNHQPEEGGTPPASEGGGTSPTKEGGTTPVDPGATAPASKERKKGRRLSTPEKNPVDPGGTSPAPESAEAERLTLLLRSEIRRTHPGVRLPDRNLPVWVREVGRMVRIDEREPADIERKIRWLFGENLRARVSFVVLSPKALRSKFDRIDVQMQRSTSRGGSRIPEGTWQRDG